MQLLHEWQCLHICLCILCTSGGLKAASSRWHIRAKPFLSTWIPSQSVMCSDLMCGTIKQTDVCFCRLRDCCHDLYLKLKTLTIYSKISTNLQDGGYPMYVYGQLTVKLKYKLTLKIVVSTSWYNALFKYFHCWAIDIYLISALHLISRLAITEKIGYTSKSKEDETFSSSFLSSTHSTFLLRHLSYFTTFPSPPISYLLIVFVLFPIYYSVTSFILSD